MDTGGGVDPDIALTAIYGADLLKRIKDVNLPIHALIGDVEGMGDYVIDQELALLERSFGYRPLYDLVLLHEGSSGHGTRITRVGLKGMLAPGMLCKFTRGLLGLQKEMGKGTATLDAYDVVLQTSCLCYIYRQMNEQTRQVLESIQLATGSRVPRMDQDWAIQAKQRPFTCVEMLSIYEALSHLVFLDDSFAE
jgi:hypothetical protein